MNDSSETCEECNTDYTCEDCRSEYDTYDIDDNSYEDSDPENPGDGSSEDFSSE